MPFGQIHFQEKLGTGSLTLAEAGCFVVADANLIEKVGVEVDPATLDAYYRDHGVFLFDFADKAYEDLSWWSVTKYRPQLTVKATGTSGFPDSDLAQVEFKYKSHTGANVTHFCAVHNAADQSIIDSWDGNIKTPAQYEPYYGKPIAWATFVDNTPQISAPAPSAPASAPQAAAPSTTPPPTNTPKQLYLPPSVWIWHIYKPGGPYTLPYALSHTLDPKMYGGLTYDIVGNPAPNIYLINTQMFGQVAIYAGPDTAAQFIGGHGEGEDTTKASVSIPVTEVVPAPVPGTPATAPLSVNYTRFTDGAMHLMTKAGAQETNFVSNAVVSQPEAGTPFNAVGKATLVNGDVYFMNENNFGTADQTQQTPITVGYKTVDLEFAPIPPTPATDPAAQPSAAPTFTNATPDQLKQMWQKITYFPDGDRKSVVRGNKGESFAVINFETGEEADVPAGKGVTAAGWFFFGGHKYYISRSSIENGTWYGFPVVLLERQNAHNTPFEADDDVNAIDHELNGIRPAKRAVIKGGATATAFMARFKKQRS